jgi:hypothetical protein
MGIESTFCKLVRCRRESHARSLGSRSIHRSSQKNQRVESATIMEGRECWWAGGQSAAIPPFPMYPTKHGRRFERAASDVWIASALFIADLLLIGPWLTTDLSSQPWNNGYIYIAAARMFRDRSSLWNALQFGGSPFHWVYPPLLPTLVSMLRFLSIGRAFHLVSGIGYALAPACLYILGRQLFRSRLPAVFGALAFALFPSLIYALPQMRVLGHPYAYAPWSFVALVAYDEAPHAFALPFVLLAVAAAWRNR